MEIGLRNIVVVFLFCFLLASCVSQSQRSIGTPTQAAASVPPKKVSKEEAGIDNRSPAPVTPSDIELNQRPRTNIDAPAPVSAKANRNDRVYFSNGKTAVDEPDRELLRHHASLLKKNSRLVLILLVFTDNQGSRTYNLAMSERWIDSIVGTLRSFGVKKLQIRTVIAGRRKNFEACSTLTCRQQNRRVELTYKK